MVTPIYTYQNIMKRRMKSEKWSQRKVAKFVSDKIGRPVDVAQINRLLKPKPNIPAGDILVALAEIFETDPAMFVASVYSSRYSGNELLGMSDFVREKFEQANDNTRRRVIEILREGE